MSELSSNAGAHEGFDVHVAIWYPRSEHANVILCFLLRFHDGIFFLDCVDVPASAEGWHNACCLSGRGWKHDMPSGQARACPVSGRPPRNQSRSLVSIGWRPQRPAAARLKHGRAPCHRHPRPPE
eukprot:1139617-Pelagomonas_calceolata.AAC.2